MAAAEVGDGVTGVTPEQVAEDLDAYVRVAPSVARDERPEVVLIDPGPSVPPGPRAPQSSLRIAAPVG